MLSSKMIPFILKAQYIHKYFPVYKNEWTMVFHKSYVSNPFKKYAVLSLYIGLSI